MTSLSPPPEISSKLVYSLFEYWQRKCAGRRAPRWRDIDPGDIKPALPYVAVLDVLESPFDVRYRLTGSALVEAVGREYTGRTLRSLNLVTDLNAWLTHYHRVVSDRRPSYGRYRGELGPDLLRSVDHAAFPVSDDGEQVNRILEIEDWSTMQAFGANRIDTFVWRFDLL
jgi:hypothetical protein